MIAYICNDKSAARVENLAAVGHQLYNFHKCPINLRRRVLRSTSPDRWAWHDVVCDSDIRIKQNARIGRLIKIDT